MENPPWLKVEHDEDGRATVFVTETHLLDFPKFMFFLVKYKVGLDKGFVKVKPVGAVPSTTLDELCAFARDFFASLTPPKPEFNFEEVSEPYPVEQRFYFGSVTEHLYGFEQLVCTPSQFKNFCEQAGDPDTYKCHTWCCDKALNVSLCDLEAHYWQHVSSLAVKSQAMGKYVSVKQVRELLLKGSEAMKKIYPNAEFRSESNQGSSDFSGGLVHRKCTNRKRAPQSILYFPGIPLEYDQFPIFSNFSLSKLGTILDLHPEKIPGISYPYLYIGSKHASFPWHIEDQGLFSINYLHFGAPCLWRIVAPKDYKRLSECIHHFPLDPGRISCSFCLVHKYPLCSGECLKKAGIRVETVLQKQGEIIITYPFAAHSGFKFGFNFSQAANFADPMWVESGMVCIPCACSKSQVNMDLKEIVAAVRPDLLTMYINKDFIGLMKAVSINEFVKLLGIIPSVEDSDSAESSQKDKGTEPWYEEVDECNDVVVEEVGESGTSNIPSSFKGARYTISCPDGCGKTFEGGRGRLPRMINHVVKKHPEKPDLVAVLQASNPAKKLTSRFLICPICGEEKAGNKFHLNQHIKNKHSK